jgi:hypothetical protein
MMLADRLNRRIDYRDVRIHIPGKRDGNHIERRWQQRPRESAALLSKRSMYIADQALCARCGVVAEKDAIRTSQYDRGLVSHGEN